MRACVPLCLQRCQLTLTAHTYHLLHPLLPFSIFLSSHPKFTPFASHMFFFISVFIPPFEILIISKQANNLIWNSAKDQESIYVFVCVCKRTCVFVAFVFVVGKLTHDPYL